MPAYIIKTYARARVFLPESKPCAIFAPHSSRRIHCTYEVLMKSEDYSIKHISGSKKSVHSFGEVKLPSATPTRLNNVET